MHGQPGVPVPFWHGNPNCFALTSLLSKHCWYPTLLSPSLHPDALPSSLPLMGRSGTSRRSGRLIVGVTILEKRQYKEVG